MSFNFKAIPKKNPQNQAAAAKFYASPVYSGQVTIRQLAKKIADISTVSSIDTLAVLEAFLQLIPEEMAQGNIIRLRDFGTFRLSISSEGVDEASKLSSTNIKKSKILFRPSREFSDITNKVKFIKTE